MKGFVVLHSKQLSKYLFCNEVDAKNACIQLNKDHSAKDCEAEAYFLPLDEYIDICKSNEININEINFDKYKGN